MEDRVTPQTWIGRGVFLALCVAIIGVTLLPGEMQPPRFAMPDFLLAVTLAWVIRKPGQAPLFSIFAVFVLADLIYMRPPGLWALIMLWTTEIIRRRHNDYRTIPLLMEWASVATIIATATLIYAVVLSLFVLPLPPLRLFLMQTTGTIVIYPLVALSCQFAFGLSHELGQDRSRRKQMI